MNKNLLIALLWLIAACLMGASALVNEVKTFIMFAAVFDLLLSIFYFGRYIKERRA